MAARKGDRVSGRKESTARTGGDAAALRTVADRVAAGDLRAVLFDLDGVITDTAGLHAVAWKRLFDDFLQARAVAEPFEPFRLPEDYLAYVDGKPRYDGVRSFLAARSIALPDGSPTDRDDSQTVCGLGNRKDALFNIALAEQGVSIFEPSIRFIWALRACAVATACVSSSKNCRPVLARARLLDLFDAVVDGCDIENGLAGKPAPDSYLRAGELLGVPPEAAAVVEDALSGVAAGRAGRFGLVIGVDRGAGRAALIDHGADLVVADLDELLPLKEG